MADSPSRFRIDEHGRLVFDGESGELSEPSEAEYLPDGQINVPGDVPPARPPRLSKTVAWVALGGFLVAFASDYFSFFGDILFAAGIAMLGWSLLMLWSYWRELR